LPASQKLLISEFRSKHLEKLISTEGVIRQKSNVRPYAVSSKFECPSCGNIINILQSGQKYIEPSRCGCGRKGGFIEISKELIDGQTMVLEESPDDLDGKQPKRINVFLKNDLTSQNIDKKTPPGTRVRLTGWVAEIPINNGRGSKSNKLDFIFEANSIEPLDEERTIIISEKNKEEIIEFSRNKNCVEILKENILPQIYGYDEIKKSFLYSLVGGVKRIINGSTKRKEIHILIAGEPGLSKSQMIKGIQNIPCKVRYTSGTGASGCGLTASVVKDEILGGWALEAGAVVLAHKGYVLLDEFDKMGYDDREHLHETMEQGTVSINKANIQATLKAETTIIACCNPKNAKFDDYKDNFCEQVEMPASLVNRFDLIFKLIDIPDSNRDKKLSLHMLNFKDEKQDIIIDSKFIRQYIYYASKLEPKWTEESIKYVVNWYDNVRKIANRNSIPINPRQQEALRRLSEADAKLKLNDKVELDNVKSAWKVLEFSLKQLGCIKQDGRIEFDTINGGIGSEKNSVLQQIKISGKISFDDLFNRLNFPKNKLQKIINSSLRDGIINESPSGTYRLL